MSVGPGGAPLGGPPPGGPMPPGPDPNAAAPGPDPSMVLPGPAPSPPPSMGGLGPASPLAFAFTDVSADLTEGWQLVDIACTVLGTALRTADFQTQPKSAAVVTDAKNTLSQLVSHYTSAKKRASDTSTADADAGGSGGANGSSTSSMLEGADAQP